jgi:cytochrome P450
MTDVPAYFNPMSPAFRRHPYATYSRLREENPIVFYPDLNAWFLTRYDDVEGILKEPHLQNSATGGANAGELPDVVREFMELRNNWLFAMDPPRHTRVRALVHKAFSPARIRDLRSVVQRITDELLDEVEDAGRMDIIKDFADPLPMRVIAYMLGVKVDDYDRFAEYSDKLVAGLDVGAPPEHMMMSMQVALDLRDYFEELLQEKRQNPSDDVLSVLLEAEEDGETLSHDELIATAVNLLTAGYETTTNLIGNGVLALLENPDQYDLVRNDTSLVGEMVEEVIRYYPPTSAVNRYVSDDFEYKGHQMKAGQMLFPMTAAANRDPARFENPDVFDIQREDKKHLTFGYGIHFCIGAPLARLEGDIAFRTLLERFDNLQLAVDAVQWQPVFMTSGLESLPVTFDVK